MMFQEVSSDWLEDVSYTASYSFVGDSWDAFHDYIPDKMFHLRKGLYSFKDGHIYKHNANNNCRFYGGTTYSSMITKVFNIGEMKHFVLNNVMFQTDCTNTEGVRLDKTFDSIAVYNAYQSSLIVDVVPFDRGLSFDTNYDLANTRRLNSMWFFNRLRDLKAAETIHHVREVRDRLLFNVANQTVPDGLTRVKDNYLVVYLVFDNVEQDNFAIYNIDINANQVQR